MNLRIFYENLALFTAAHELPRDFIDRCVVSLRIFCDRGSHRCQFLLARQRCHSKGAAGFWMMGNNQTIPTPSNHEELDTISDPARWGLVVFNICISVVGSLGNISTILTILLCRKLWTTPNVYIVHLAVVDLIVCAGVVPVSVLGEINPKWVSKFIRFFILILGVDYSIL